jgi:tetratricopeptide (TPR) repeat protein
MRTGSKQLLLIAGATALTAALYFAPKVIINDSGTNKSGNEFSFDALAAEAKGQLKRQEAEQINSVEAELKKNPSSLNLIDSLGKMWDRLNMPQVSSHYYELVAENNQDEKSWINTAYRYYDAFRITGDSTLRKFYVEKAILSYQNVLKINPDNLDAKTDLGLCYAEGTSSPMQGITLLREVVEKNPRHEMAQFNLGILSVRSGQYDKAVERFQKVLEINPSNKEARFLLGRTFSAMGKNDLALENLNMIKESGDSQFNEEVKNLINKINNN